MERTQVRLEAGEDFHNDNQNEMSPREGHVTASQEVGGHKPIEEAPYNSNPEPFLAPIPADNEQTLVKACEETTFVQKREMTFDVNQNAPDGVNEQEKDLEATQQAFGQA